MSNQLIIFFVLVLVATMWWALRIEDGRRRRLRRLADSIQARFRPRARSELRDQLGELALWQYGHAHELSHVIERTGGAIDFVCLSDTFDVGFGRERFRRTHLLMVATVGSDRPGLVCLREGHFDPCGPHARYIPFHAPGEPEQAAPERPEWRIWCEPDQDPTSVWDRLRETCEQLSGPCLVETRGDALMICRPGLSEPDEYRRIIETGLELARRLAE